MTTEPTLFPPEIADEIKKYLNAPDHMWGKDVSRDNKLKLAYVAVKYGFDPFVGDLDILQGRVYVTSTGLRKLANRKKCRGTRVKAVYEDWPSKTFVFEATVYPAQGSLGFQDQGSASPEDVTSQVAKKGVGAIRAVAITRAVNRALRSAYSLDDDPDIEVLETDDVAFDEDDIPVPDVDEPATESANRLPEGNLPSDGSRSTPSSATSGAKHDGGMKDDHTSAKGSESSSKPSEPKPETRSIPDLKRELNETLRSKGFDRDQIAEWVNEKKKINGDWTTTELVRLIEWAQKEEKKR